MPTTLFKKDFNAGVFLCKIFKNTFFTEHLWWLLLLPKQIKRKIKRTDTLQVFLLKHNDAKKIEVITKFNGSVFF